MESEKFEAIGPRGEACIIVMHHGHLPSGEAVETYTLATGDKLRPTDVPSEFVTISGSRTFRLRNQGDASPQVKGLQAGVDDQAVGTRA